MKNLKKLDEYKVEPMIYKINNFLKEKKKEDEKTAREVEDWKKEDENINREDEDLKKDPIKLN